MDELTLRDLFAAFALAGLLEDFDVKTAADLAFKAADAMMERRKAEPK